MTDLCPSRSKAILVGLLCSFGLALACSNTAPPPALARPGSGGSKASGGSGGSSASGGISGTATGGVTATGGTAAGGAGGTDNTGDGPAADATVAEDTAPDSSPEDVLPTPDAPGCTNPCNTSRKRCSNDVVQDCVMVNGCPTWHDAVACAAPQVCAQQTNTAACACPVSCTAGRHRCNNGMLEECGAANGCPAWVNPTACTAPMTCMMTNTNASCGCPTGPCQTGDTKCANGGLQECKAAGPGTCPDWQAAVACPANKECTDPAGNPPADCRCRNVCTVGQKKCDNGQLAECVSVDGCGAWKNTTCPAGQMCNMGSNTASCGCPADACKIGEKRCPSAGVLEECNGVGTCGTWQAAQTCAANQECTQPGNQAAACRCKPTCTLNETKCTGGANTALMQTCKATAANGCNQFENTPCDSGTICAPGSKPACVCPGGADACKQGDERCLDDGKGGGRHQACVVQGQCGTFGDAPCVGNTACKAGDKGKDLCATPAVVCSNKCTVGDTKCVTNGGAATIQKCMDPDGNGPLCPDFANDHACTAEEKCPGNSPKNAICCPSACVEICDANPKRIKVCKVDPTTGCTVPIAEDCPTNTTCKKVNQGVGCTGS
jgi:hypothetical protein